ncbi:AfsR/SARP family transcriptional regulator [Tenggerimyces flavus]|uniref:BTAD domain-containing putative transcriptional regulator n=1 Tax=Tenggerimyces flavus TaxID=1708749 RepID=A0ABV7Y5B5_9ACTN|nr:AfsR/SARP family transcriptional regulator [Tenggerimyces flavus]MBM7790806.1 DNA-binding SARP family transcriptional activator [Tenggerimyces flavus]
MELALLGPVQATSAGRQLSLGPRKRRLLLALLGLEVGRVVPWDRLVALMWETAPPGALGVVRAHVSRLRAAGVPLETVGTGYRLALEPDLVDACRFERLVQEGALRPALALWRGPALVDVADPPLRARLCRTLEDQRLAALAAVVDADLARGRHRELVGELAELVSEDPRFARPLMLALYRSGRQADALAAFQRVRARLASEYGSKPSPEVEELHSAILRGDPSLELSAFPASPALVGRTAELNALDELVPESSLALVVGPAGVGKTALAVLWAHRVRSRFPDGLLYVSLGQSDPLDALFELLALLGVSSPPAELDRAASLYRSLLADRRVLVLLDDATNVAQVRPLLPGSAGCVVLVTSRAALGGLVAREGAFRLVLEASRR